MKKFFVKYTIIIFVNLLAFLILGHILDVLFGGGAKFKVIFLIVSIVPLLVMGSILVKKSIADLEDIKTSKK